MDNFTYSKKNTRWLYIGISTVIIYLWHGYQFGRNDQIEWLPYALHIANPDLFNTDLYIQHVTNQWPNERWFLAKLFSFVIPNEAIFSFVLHIMSLALLCYSFFRITHESIKNNLITTLGLLLLIIPLSKIDLGSNEIYYNYMVSSVPAKALGAFCILLALKEKWIAVSIVLVLVTLLQTLVGIQLFVLLFATGIVCKLIERRPQKTLLISIGIYAILIGWWIINMLNATEDIGNVSLYKLFSFRIPHHFIPGTFGIWNFILTGIMLGFAQWWFAKKKWFFPLIFTFIILLGCIVYVLSVGLIQNELVLKTQWFKTTIWIEFWFSIALISSFIDFIKWSKIPNRTVTILMISTIAGVSIFSLIYRSPVYQFPFKNEVDTEIAIAKDIRENIKDNESTFIIPFENTTFKYWSNKGAYVDFKSVLHSPQYLNLWFSRIESLYGLNINSRLITSDKGTQAKNHFLSLKEVDFLKTTADYLLTYNHHVLNFKVVTKNDDWVVYKIEEP